MPELPEIESIKRSLEDYLINQKILNTNVLLPKLVSGVGNKRKENPDKTREFILGTKNKKIIEISRRNKNLLISFEDNSAIVFHLKMTGQLVFKPNQKENKLVVGGHPIELSNFQIPNKHTYLIFELENGNLYYNDVRKFGYILYFKDKNSYNFQNHFINLGLEPFDENFTIKYFKKKLKESKSILKKIFLDQKIVVGLGNIYSDEVCFLAKVLPYRVTSTLTKKEIEDLYNGILYILNLAILNGGSSVANYLLGDGTKGNFAKYHKVYKRAGKKCLNCDQILLSKKVAGRTTVFCKKCQK